jgi:hypothetical protein
MGNFDLIKLIKKKDKIFIMIFLKIFLTFFYTPHSYYSIFLIHKTPCILEFFLSPGLDLLLLSKCQPFRIFSETKNSSRGFSIVKLFHTRSKKSFAIIRPKGSIPKFLLIIFFNFSPFYFHSISNVYKIFNLCGKIKQSCWHTVIFNDSN